MRVLAFVDYYLPGYKGGGPAVSVSRRAAAMASRAEFFVFTRDRDLGDDDFYPGIEVDRWHDGLYYASPGGLGAAAIERAVCAAAPDVIYLNSFFSRLTRTVLRLRLKGLLVSTPVVIAPRGELDPGALSIKATKKRAYLAMVRLSGLCNGVRWHATSEQERAHILEVFEEADYFVAAETPPAPCSRATVSKSPGECRFVFLSRISRKKNLDFAVRAMAKLRGDTLLTVYGPIEDGEYWSQVVGLAESLGVQMVHEGAVRQAQVSDVLAEHHFFVLPTLGENFCHVIAESLAAGVPCVISDRTPWTEVGPRGAGFVLPLEDEAAWGRVLQACVDMGDDAYKGQIGQVRSYYEGRFAEASEDDSFEILPETRKAA